MNSVMIWLIGRSPVPPTSFSSISAWCSERSASWVTLLPALGPSHQFVSGRRYSHRKCRQALLRFALRRDRLTGHFRPVS